MGRKILEEISISTTALCLIGISIFLSGCLGGKEFNAASTGSSPVNSTKLSFESKVDGTGVQLTGITLEISKTFNIFSIERIENNFNQNVTVTWSMSGNIGNLNILSGGKQAQLTTTTIGNGTITATLGTITKTINVEVIASPNGPPVAVSDSVMTIQDISIPSISVLTNDSDPDSDTLSILSFTHGASGTVTNNGDGTLSYTPGAGYYGKDSFTYTIDDGNGETDTTTVTVRVMTPYTWTGAAGNSNWSDDTSDGTPTASNWCGTVTANTCDGGVMPPSGGLAVFDNTCSLNCDATVDVNTTIDGLFLMSTYNGTVTQGMGVTLNIRNTGFKIESGTFQGSDANITIYKGLWISADGTFNSTSASLIFNAPSCQQGAATPYIDIDPSSVFSMGTGALYIGRTGGNNYNQCYLKFDPSLVFNNVTIGPSSGGYHSADIHIINESMKINGSLSLGDLDLRGVANYLVTGDVTIYGNLSATTDITISLVGTGNQNFTDNSGGGISPHIFVNKASGTVLQTTNLLFNWGDTDLQIQQGFWDMGGFNLDIGQFILDTGTTLTRSGGTLNVGGSPPPDGAYSNGTISP